MCGASPRDTVLIPGTLDSEVVVSDDKICGIVRSAQRRIVKRTEGGQAAGDDGQILRRDAGAEHDAVVVVRTYPLRNMRSFNYGDEPPVAPLDLINIAAQAADCPIEPLKIRERVVAGAPVQRKAAELRAVEPVVVIAARQRLAVSTGNERVVPRIPVQRNVRPATAQNIVATVTIHRNKATTGRRDRVVQKCRATGIGRFVACKQRGRIPRRTIRKFNLLDLDAARDRIVVDKNGIQTAIEAQLEGDACARHRDFIRCYPGLESQRIVAARIGYANAERTASQ